jgi:hypothetical protein
MKTEKLAKLIESIPIDQLNELYSAHGIEITIKAPGKFQPATDPHPCPTGYYWNGSACVLNVG